MMREQAKEPGGLNNMDWSQWQNVAGSGQFPNQQNGQQNWNNQMRNQNPGWIRPGQQQPQPNWPGQQQGQPQQPGGQGQPRPGVHPEDWNNNNRVPPPPPNGPPPGSNGWPPQQPPGRPPPPPNGPPPGWDEQMKNRLSSRHVFFLNFLNTNLMSGLYHLNRASNVEIGVECQIFVVVIFLTAAEFFKVL